MSPISRPNGVSGKSVIPPVSGCSVISLLKTIVVMDSVIPAKTWEVGDLVLPCVRRVPKGVVGLGDRVDLPSTGLGGSVLIAAVFVIVKTKLGACIWEHHGPKFPFLI